MTTPLLPPPGGDLLVLISPVLLVALRLLDGRVSRLLSVTLDGRTLESWTLDRLVAVIGALRPDRVLIAERPEVSPRVAALVGNTLRRSALQAGIDLVEIPDPMSLAVHLARGAAFARPTRAPSSNRMHARLDHLFHRFRRRL